ncbi:MAG: N-acetyltransferase, partial [Pseudomonadota bacterium]
MTPATEADRPWIEARLQARLSGSMFPLTNLREHGWDSGAARSMRFWIDRRRGAVLGVSREGMLMPQVPDRG